MHLCGLLTALNENEWLKYSSGLSKAGSAGAMQLHLALLRRAALAEARLDP